MSKKLSSQFPDHGSNQHQHQTNQQKINFKKITKTSSLDYKGMTLQQYFKIPDTGRIVHYHDFKFDHEYIDKGNNTVALVFNSLNLKPRQSCQKYTQNQIILRDNKQNPFMLPPASSTKRAKIQKLFTQIRSKDARKKKTSRQLTQNSDDKHHFNHSTITPFYQLQKKRKKMLDKVKHSQQKVDTLKLTQAFFITKYADKFKIYPHPRAY